jgi:NADP-dependent 3-hydroxy acid dehydrogenase YdfG
VTALAENTRLLVTADGVGVTLVAPGRVDTPFWNDHGGPPPGRNLSPDEVAATIAWSLTQPSDVDINTLTVRPAGAPV